MKAAMEGLRVLDFGMFIAGPLASRLLADLGASVIKVEPLEGETFRPASYDFPAYKGFNNTQRGKRCIALNLRAEEGQAVVHKLMAQADVVQHNFRPGVAERLNIDYEAARRLNPRVIYCFSPAYGSVGPRRHFPGFEPLYSAFVGVHYNNGGRGNPPAQSTSFDQYCGLLAANAILMALYHRDRTGQGQYIEVPQLGAVMYYTSDVFIGPDGRTVSEGLLDQEQAGYGPLNRLYRTRDGWLCIACWQEAEWQALFRALGCQEVLADARFQGQESLRQSEELAALLGACFATRTTQEWLAVLEREGVPFEVPDMEGERTLLLKDENVASGRVAEYQHPVWGRMREPGATVRLSMTPGRIEGPAPLLGQHSREILAELGFTPQEMARLREQGVTAWPE
ncbi:MAG: CoA transferase [Chloroflexi bacterium]|nr:CoA transferase [Chloroflexota bacterium]